MSEPPIAIVTGGSAGIGAAICRDMLEAGYKVVSLARRLPGWSHPRLTGLSVDLFDEAGTAGAARDIAARFPVSHIVHNAGVILPKLLEDVQADDLARLTQLHLGAALALVQAALPGMKERRFGRIVLVSSRAALGLATRTAYSATKAGMIGMARTWALELGPHGITVNVVAPGPIKTDMFHAVIPAGSEKEGAVAASIPVRRVGLPEDVSRAVMFFCAPEAGFVTGQTLYVCGGASIGSVAL
jgi:3-oxoacyl-[acyl-carrier protein] reductase